MVIIFAFVFAIMFAIMFVVMFAIVLAIIFVMLFVNTIQIRFVNISLIMGSQDPHWSDGVLSFEPVSLLEAVAKNNLDCL